MSELKEDLRYVNKEKIEETTELAINNNDVLSELIEISLQNDEYISQHAALIVQSIAKTKPEVLSPYLEKIVKTIPELQNDSQLGNFVEMLEFVNTDCSIIYDFCFDLIENKDRPGFVKIYSVKMLGIAAQRDKVLKLRLINFIEEKQESISSTYLKREALKVLDTLKGKTQNDDSTFV